MFQSSPPPRARQRYLADVDAQRSDKRHKEAATFGEQEQAPQNIHWEAGRVANKPLATRVM